MGETWGDSQISRWGQRGPGSAPRRGPAHKVSVSSQGPKDRTKGLSGSCVFLFLTRGQEKMGYLKKKIIKKNKINFLYD